MNTTETKPQEQIAEFNNAWKGRGNLQNLLTELKRQKDSCFDFVADLRHLSVSGGEGSLMLTPTTPEAGEWLPDGAIPFNDSAVVSMFFNSTYSNASAWCGLPSPGSAGWYIISVTRRYRCWSLGAPA